ncbi:MAG: NADH-quinone oxidoreductase subunit NuoK [Chitinophagaceae bacterium]|nr:NADH-quinone oxidoreductase subunit NuoK [Chitinophagaceae bacterium]
MLTQWYVILSVVLFSIGVMGVLTRRNAIVVLLCIQLMLGASALLLTAFSKMHLSHAHVFSGEQASQGQIFVLFIIVIAAIQVVTGLTIILSFYKKTHSLDINFLNRLKN